MSSETLSHKQELTQAADRYKQAIERQFSVLRHETAQKSKKILLIGGIGLSVYLLLRLATSGKEKKRKNKQATNSQENVVPIEKEKEDSFFWTTLKGVALSVALTLIRKKLIEAIAVLTETDEAKNS